MHREQKYNMQHIQDNTRYNTEQNTSTAHRTHTICTHRQTYTHAKNTDTHINTEYNIYAAHTEQNTRYDNMQHTEQHTEYNTENSTEQTQYPDTERTENSAHNYRTYSLDYYYEFAYINNSNTIELYTISKENIQKTLIS